MMDKGIFDRYLESLLRQLPIIPKLSINDTINDNINDKCTSDYNIITSDLLSQIYIPSLQLQVKYIIHDVLLTIGGFILLKWSYKCIRKATLAVYDILRNNFIISYYKNKKLSNIKSSLKDILATDNRRSINRIPATGMTVGEISTLQDTYMNYRDSGNITINDTTPSVEYIDFIMNSNKKYMYATSVHNNYPDVLIMENEIIRMTASLLNGGDNVAGTITANNTESIFLACKAYKDRGSKEMNIINPEIIIARSANPAFFKAAEILDIKLIIVDCDNYNYTIGISNIKNYINNNTICIITASVTFSHGLMDNIVEISELGFNRNIGVHVDCCNGGFLLPFITLNGNMARSYDFSLRGVTSISIDTYNYGRCLNGASLILYNNKQLHKYQYFTIENWHGGILLESSFTKDKLGPVISSTWSSLLYYGIDGYSSYAEDILKFRNNLLNDIRLNPDLQIIGEPVSGIIAITSVTINSYTVATEMAKTGWEITFLQNPKAFNVHISDKFMALNNNKKFIKDLTAAVNYTKSQTGSVSNVTPLYNSSYIMTNISDYISDDITMDVADIYEELLSNFGRLAKEDL